MHMIEEDVENAIDEVMFENVAKVLSIDGDSLNPIGEMKITGIRLIEPLEDIEFFAAWSDPFFQLSDIFLLFIDDEDE